MIADFVQSYKVMDFIMSSNVHLLDSPLEFFPENFGAESDFTRTFPPWKSGTKASGVPERWLITAGHLEGTFRRQNVSESDPPSLFM